MSAEAKGRPTTAVKSQEKRWRPSDPELTGTLTRPPAQGEKAGWSSSELLAGRRLGRGEESPTTKQ